MSPSFEEKLEAFDDRGTELLIAIRDENANRDDFLKRLLACFEHGSAAVAGGASWLILDHLKSGGTLNERQTEIFLRGLCEPGSWSHALHLCQSVRLLTVGPESVAQLAGPLQTLTGHERPMVRAWAMDALHSLSASAPSVCGIATNAVETGLNDPAASVRARARRLQAGD